MSQINIEAVDLTLNGHLIQGLSDDTDAVTMPDIELTTVRRGANGELLSFRTGNRGGEVMIKLLPSSPTHAFLQRQVAQINNPDDPARVNGALGINDVLNGIQVSCRRGVLKTAPFGQTYGQGEAANREYTFDFEEIVPQYDNASFAISGAGDGLAGVFDSTT